MSNLTIKLNNIDEGIKAMSESPSFDNAQKVVNAVINLFNIEGTDWRLFNDSQGKIRTNATWFKEALGFSDRRATYKLADSNDKNIDFKAYWAKNSSKSVISWLVALTPNFEDEDFDLGDKVGIDFIIPESADKVIVALSNRFIVRTLELSGSLSITEQEIFSKWQQDFDFSNKAQLHEILWDSFDFEPVNKKFFKEISAFFTELRQYLSEDIKIFDEKHAAYFTNRLIGRIVFCWFLDKKGIINSDMNYFEVEGRTATDFYREKLEKLFFKVLNTPIDERGDGIEKFTPFLNGGLFEEKENDKHGDKMLKFPADYFDRFFVFLRHYNFTTDESTSTFQQVAIDPEMLGRIFENLLAEQTEETGQQARKAKGAFYTPREIVDYMCKESLREYLKSKIEATEDLDQKIDQLLDSKPHEWRDQQKNYRDKLKADKYNILQALDEIKVLDPACGSGAFPMGMLHLLLQTYERIDSTFDPYKKKLNIIKNSIFGVDIEPMAVEISRLRAWLSIIVDEESDSKKIEPLPNLDFKFICANSLIPLDDSGVKKLDGDDPELEIKMRDVRDKYFNARTKKSKNEHRQKFEKIYNEANKDSLFGRSKRHEQLATYHPFDSENISQFFDSNFIFGIREFDVVIGNPPYIEFKKLKQFDKNNYKFYVSAKGKYDIYVIFLEIAEKFLKSGGIVSYINPTSFLKKDYGVHIRSFLYKNFIFKKILDFTDIQIFESAINYTGIFILQKNKNIDYEFMYHKYKNYNAKTLQFFNNLRDANNSEFKDVILVKSSELEKENWNFQNAELSELFSKIKKKSKPLSDYVSEIFQGIASGKDEVFYVDKSTVNNYLLEEELLHPILKGKDIKSYKLNWSGNYVIYPYDSNSQVINEDELKNKYPNIYLYFCENKKILSGRPYFEKSTKKWYELWNQRKVMNFNKTRIIVPEISNHNNFALTDTYYGNTKTYNIILLSSDQNDYYYFMGLLNSKLIEFYYQHITTPQAGGFYAYKSQFLKMIPILVDQKNRNNISEITKQIIDIKSKNIIEGVTPLERKINDMVYKLYELTEEEIKIVEKS